MHIPDGYLGPSTCGVLGAAILPVWAVASKNVKKTLKAKQVPMLAMGAAFSFVIMMFNVPIPGGTTGHAVGGCRCPPSRTLGGLHCHYRRSGCSSPSFR